jgi:hypothetical protein
VYRVQIRFFIIACLAVLYVHNQTMSVDEKKESIRAAVQELSSPASMMSGYEAMKTLHQAVGRDFDNHDGTIGDFVGDDDFKGEIFSARVIQVVITAAKVKEENPPNIYHLAGGILCQLCFDSTELADAFVAHNGGGFLLESLEAFSSDQFLLLTYFALYSAVVASLNENKSAGTMTLRKLVDVFELNYETADETLYYQYCQCVGNSIFRHDVKVRPEPVQCIISHVWHGVLKHKYDEDAQDVGRRLLGLLVGKESAKEMIDHAEMHHCEDEDCAGCA